MRQWPARLQGQVKDQPLRVAQDPQDLLQEEQLLHQDSTGRGKNEPLFMQNIRTEFLFSHYLCRGSDLENPHLVIFLVTKPVNYHVSPRVFISSLKQAFIILLNIFVSENCTYLIISFASVLGLG